MAYVGIGPQTDQPYTIAVVSANGTSIAAIAGVTGTVTRVYKVMLVAATAGTLTFQDGSTNLTGAMPLAANGSIVLDADGTPWFQASTGNAFNLSNPSGVSITGALWYRQDKWNPT